MALKDKYSKLTDFAKKPQVEDLSVNEDNGILYISGKASSAVKDKLWEIYGQIDPDMRSGDLVLDIKEENPTENSTIGNTTTGDSSSRVYEVKPGDNLSKIAMNYPDMTWQKIYEANKDTIVDPNVIKPGQKIRIPS